MIAISIQCDLCSDRKSIEHFKGIGFTADGYLMHDPAHASTSKHLCQKCIGSIVNNCGDQFISKPLSEIGSEP